MHSLSQRVALQFAVVLLPLLALLVYVTQAESGRAAAMNRALAIHTTAIQARDLYAQFLEGAADSVDTGRLSTRAAQALAGAAEDVARLVALQPSQALAHGELLGWLRSIDDVVRADAKTDALVRMQAPINRARQGLESLIRVNQAGLEQAVAASIDESARSRQLVLVLSALMSLMTVGFMAQFIRGLSRPLHRAVAVADRIASGHALDQVQVDDRHDIGNLLGSLQRMHQSLLDHQRNADRQRRNLEDKVAALARSQRLLDQAQAAARLGSWQWDTAQPGPEWSHELYRQLGLTAEVGRPSLRQFLRRLPAADRRSAIDNLRSVLQRLDTCAIEHRVEPAPGQERVVAHQVFATRDAAGTLTGLSGTVQDITDRRRTEERMRRLALFDGLTGLANRQFFNDHLRHAVARSKRHGTGFAVIFVDLDRFKRINDTLGHAVGDALLREAAARLVGCLRGTDEVTSALPDEPGAQEGADASMVARLGGDEFIILLRDLLSPRDAVTVASRVTAALSRPFAVDGHELTVTASLGIALYPSDGVNGDDLVKAADVAMYAAKNNGRNSFQFYSEEMNSAAYEKLSFETQLRQAIEGGQLVLHYQPQVDASSGEVTGVEALVRWLHPAWGLIAPSRFIPLAEELGLIVQIGDWVLETACRQAGAWREAGLGDVCISVNLASPSFLKPSLAQDVAALIQRHGLRPRQLQIEATESMLVQPSSTTMATLQALQAIGVQLSIDDFGTGYSSLTYLRRFPFDEIKIDQSFVAEMTQNPDDGAIVAAIVSLGRNMNRRVVAEGVETLGQVRALRSQGCHLMQGFLFSRPVPAGEVAAILGRPQPFAWAFEASAQDVA